MKTTPLNLLANGHTDLLVMNNVNSSGAQTNLWITLKDGIATCGKNTFNLLPDFMEKDFKEAKSFETVEGVIDYLGDDWVARKLYHAVGIIGSDDKKAQITPIGGQIREHKQKENEGMMTKKDAAIYEVNADWQQAIINELGAGHYRSAHGCITESTSRLTTGSGENTFTFTTIKMQRCQKNEEVVAFFSDNYMGQHLCHSMNL